MHTFINQFRLPVLQYGVGGFLPAIILGFLGGALVESMFGGMPAFAQVLRAVILIALAYWGAPASARFLAGRGLVSTDPKRDAGRAAILYATVHVGIMSVLVYSGISASGATVLLPYFWIMVFGNIAASWVFYRRSGKGLQGARAMSTMMAGG